MAASGRGESDASAVSNCVSAAQLQPADAGIFANPVWMQRLSEFSGNAPKAGPLFNTAAGGSFLVQVSAEGMNTNAAQRLMTDEDARQCEKLFERYVETFISAINSGKTAGRGQRGLPAAESTCAELSQAGDSRESEAV